jgi:hypothetical protein
MVSFEKDLVDGVNLHRSGWASGYAEFADAALPLVESDGHSWALYCKGASGAYGCTRAAMGALFLNTLDFLRSIVNLNSLIFKVFYALPKFFFVAGQLQHHHPFFARQNGGIQNIEGQIVVFGQIANDRFLGSNGRKP